MIDPNDPIDRTFLWHFTYDSAGRGSNVQMQVFSSEQEFYETRRSAQTLIPVSLPLRQDLSQNENRSSRQIESLPLSELVAQGRQLWQAIPEHVRQPLIELIPTQICWLKISSNSPVINQLAWEWLGDNQGPLALRANLCLSRCVPVRMAIPPAAVRPPMRVLLAITNPKDDRLLNPSQEIHAVQSRLIHPPYELQVLEEPTWQAMLDKLNSWQPHILHYIGHAGISRGEGNLILHDYNNISHWISGEQLAHSLPVTTRLLCLSTCFTAPNYQILGLPRLAHSPAGYNLPTAIANQYPVSENGVQQFWTQFYSTLADNLGNVRESFNRAQKSLAVDVATGTDWGSFMMVARDQMGAPFRFEAAQPMFGYGIKEIAFGLNDRGLASAEEIENITAQLSSRLVNDLSERFLTLGSQVPDSIQMQIDHESARASDLLKKIEGRKFQ